MLKHPILLNQTRICTLIIFETTIISEILIILKLLIILETLIIFWKLLILPNRCFKIFQQIVKGTFKT